jgi:C1A family cysteine protease
MSNLKISDLVADLQKGDTQWQARETTISQLPDPQQKALLGVIVNTSELASVMKRSVGETPVADFALEVDWRNHNGNHITAVKDQGGCGSCVSFCVTSVVEAITSIEKGQLLDLSEADLHFCSSHGANCNGWWPTDAFEQVKTRGIPDEASFPYATAFPDNNIWHQPPTCKHSNDRDAKAVRITNSTIIADVIQRKNYLSNHGPCSAVLHVYEDFFAYGDGVYKHVSGADYGLHCVTIIGYSEVEHCWICKNSWGSGWGKGGFFKIAYGEAGIDTEFPFWTASGVVLPTPTYGWHGYENLGGLLSSRPNAVSWGNNRIDVVVRGMDSAVYHKWWNGSSWNGWESLGGQIQGAPTICSWANGRLDIFATGLNHHLYHKWYQGGWSGWEDLGGVLSSEPTCVSWGHNRIDIFARGLNSAMWHLWYDGAWHGWEDLGGVITTAPAVCSWSAGRLDCFARGQDNLLWHKWFDNGWSGWENLHSNMFGSPAAVSWSAGRIDVFFPGQTYNMMHKWWDGQHWSGDENLGGILSSDVGVSSWAPGRLDCFVEGTDSAMYHKWYV